MRGGEEEMEGRVRDRMGMEGKEGREGRGRRCRGDD